MYIQSFLVRGTGHFPYDMLRYDGCWPSTSDDVLEMTYESRESRVVKLTRYTRTKKEMPTTGRWTSFGWNVVKDSISTFKD